MAARAVPAPLAAIPNILTIARLILIPVFVALVLICDGGHSWAAAIIFGVAGVTDQIDGWLARRWKVESEFGKVADPLADRLMIDAAVVLLWHAGRLPWVALAIPARDLALIAGYKVVVGRGYELAVNLAGKAATWLLYASLAFVMVTREGTDWPLWLFWSGFGLSGVPVVGKPCMEHIVELLHSHGLDDVIVTVAFLPQAIRGYFGDGETLGVNIEYSVEESPLGTAGSVRLASGKLDDTFVVISGDALTDVDLTKIVDFHREREAAVTIGLKSVENPLEFGIVVTDDDGRIERFLEKPSWGQVFSDTINTGIYVLEPEVLRHVPTGRPYDFSKELFPLLLEMGRPLYGYAFDEYWQDIGDLDQFRQANFDALDEAVKLNVPGIRIRGNVWVGEGVELDDLDQIDGPAFVGNYSRIAADATVAPYSVLSSSVTLRERARKIGRASC